MAFTENSKMRDILKNPEGHAVVKKYIPGLIDSPRLKLTMPMTIKKVATFPQVGLSPEQIEQLLAELAAVE